MTAIIGIPIASIKLTIMPNCIFRQMEEEMDSTYLEELDVEQTY